jgi:hypothetical protein
MYTITHWAEKVHGANFQFISDGKTLQCSTRKNLLDVNEGEFFGFQTMVARKRKDVVALCAFLMLRHPTTMRVRLYGELFGGGVAYK